MGIIPTFQAIQEGMPFTIASIAFLIVSLQCSDLPIKLKWVDQETPITKENGKYDWRAICLAVLEKACVEARADALCSDAVSYAEVEEDDDDDDAEAQKNEPDQPAEEEEFTDQGTKHTVLTTMKERYEAHFSMIQVSLSEAKLKYKLKMAELGVFTNSPNLDLGSDDEGAQEDDDEDAVTNFSIDDLVDQDFDTIADNLASIIVEKREDAYRAMDGMATQLKDAQQSHRMEELQVALSNASQPRQGIMDFDAEDLMEPREDVARNDSHSSDEWDAAEHAAYTKKLKVVESSETAFEMVDYEDDGLDELCLF